MQSKTPLDVRLIRLLRCVIGLLMIAAVGVNGANVIGRYVFLKPFVWAEEAMQFMHLWMVMLGAAILTGRGTHLKMDAIYILVSPRVRRVLDVLTNLLGILVSLYIIVAATQIIRMLAANGQRSVIARVPMAWMYGIIPFGFGCGILLLVIWFYRLCRGQAPESVSRELAAPAEMTR
jgi:TRAP-type C4-dicarboxylate transport system permease small subunit